MEPFSRDHNVGLILARRLSSCDGDARVVDEFVVLWRAELRDHFDEEERLLGPLCSREDLERLLSEHRAISKLASVADGGGLIATDAQTLGVLLNDHIRWEERTLFPRIEASASDDALNQLALETEKLEDRRGLLPTNAHRKQLVQRRRLHQEQSTRDL